MTRAFWLIVVLFGIPGTAFGQSDLSDSQTLHALLTEVRALCAFGKRACLERAQADKFISRVVGD